MRLCAIATVLFACASVGTAADEKDDTAKEKKAELACKSLLQACEAYHLNPANADADYPKTLNDLLKPPFGGSSYLKNGEKDLLDPWGKPFKYAVGKKDDGTEVAYVWSERSIDGKTKVTGTKPPEPKKK